MFLFNSKRYYLNQCIENVTDTSKKGVELLGKKLDDEIIEAWYKLVYSVLGCTDTVFRKYFDMNVDYLSKFMQLDLDKDNITSKAKNTKSKKHADYLYNTVKKHTEYLIEVLTQLKRLETFV